jgi:putative FmdB family regulatory protein
MPIYEYECDACGQRFEMIKRFSDPLADTCAICGKGPVHRLLSSPAIQFKGSGWYITDYAQKGKTDAGAVGAGKSEGAKTSDKGEKTEKKSSGSETAVKTPAAKAD